MREYYNLKKEQEGKIEELTNDDVSDVGESEMDEEGFDGEAYVKRVLETQNLEELLRTYNGVLTGQYNFREIETSCLLAISVVYLTELDC